MAGLVASKITISVSTVLGCLGKWSGKTDAGKAPPSPLFYRIDEEGPFLDHVFYFDRTSLCMSGRSVSPRSRGTRASAHGQWELSCISVVGLGSVLFVPWPQNPIVSVWSALTPFSQKPCYFWSVILQNAILFGIMVKMTEYC